MSRVSRCRLGCAVTLPCNAAAQNFNRDTLQCSKKDRGTRPTRSAYRSRAKRTAPVTACASTTRRASFHRSRRSRARRSRGRGGSTRSARKPGRTVGRRGSGRIRSGRTVVCLLQSPARPAGPDGPGDRCAEAETDDGQGLAAHSPDRLRIGHGTSSGIPSIIGRCRPSCEPSRRRGPGETGTPGGSPGPPGRGQHPDGDRETGTGTGDPRTSPSRTGHHRPDCPWPGNRGLTPPRRASRRPAPRPRRRTTARPWPR